MADRAGERLGRPEGDPAATEAPGRTAVMVVHGVGNPQPGEVLGNFTAALAADGSSPLRLDGPVVARQIEDRSHPRGAVRTFFPLHYLTGTLDGRQVVFAEAFWGSVSTLTPGAMGVLRSLFELIFGLDSINRANRGSDRPGGWERAAMRLASIGSEIFRGPILAANLGFFLAIALALTLGFAIGPEPGKGGLPHDKWAWKVMPLVCVAVICFGLWILGRIRAEAAFQGHRVWAAYRWFGRSCVLLGVYWPLAGWIWRPAIWLDWGNLAMVPMLIGFTLVAFLVVVVWLMYLATWLPGFRRQVRRSMSARAMALSLQFGLWQLVVPTLWLAVFSRLGETAGDASINPWIVFYRAGVPSDGVPWLFLPLPVVVLGYVVLRRRIAASRALGVGGSSDSPGPLPRLLLAPSVREAIMISAVYTVVTAALLTIEQKFVGAAHLSAFIIPESWLGWIRDTELRAMPAVGLVIGFSFLSAGVRLALDVANDVIYYLRLKVGEEERGLHRGVEEVERLRPIRGKFNETLRFLHREFGFDRLIIVAHSQGTVVALDELTHSSFGERRDWLQRLDVTLVTMGSPMANLYQHYFPLAYPPWPHQHWNELWARLDRWLNLYRLDDAVGTAMDPAPADGPRFRETCVGPGGHVDYWSDRRVIEEIRRVGRL